MPKKQARQAIINVLSIVAESIIYEDMAEEKLNLEGLLNECTGEVKYDIR